MNQRIVYIFVAGSTVLEDERTIFKAIANDLNIEYEQMDRNLKLHVCSCELLPDKQSEYMSFIEEKSNLIIFVLDGTIGEKTKDEFLFAAKCLHMNDRPTIMVFLKDYEEETMDIRYITGLIDGSTNDSYFVRYKDLANLKEVGTNKLRVYLNSMIVKEKKSFSISEFFGANRAVIAVVVIILIFLAGVQIAYKFYSKKNAPAQLMILGGGSAVNYVDSLYMAIKDYDGGFYVNLASGSSWNVLAEDVAKNCEDVTKRRYYPICFSAEEAAESNFLTVVSDESKFKNIGSVISVRIGYDTLSVCVKSDKTIMDALHVDSLSNRVNVGDLANLLKTSNVSSLNLYTTSQYSGTRHKYESVLALRFDDLKLCKKDFFNEQSELKFLQSPYIVFGSKYYYMNALHNNSDCIDLILMDSTGKQPVTKPIYIYFMAYNVESKNIDGKDLLWIPKPTLDFLKILFSRINGLENIIDQKVNGNGQIIRDKPDVVLDMRSLPNKY